MKLIIENWRKYLTESQSTPKTQEELDIVFKILEKANIQGFSGACAEAAMAINNVLFEGEGVIVVAANEYMWKRHGSMIGHVAVYYEPEGTYWDTEGEKRWIDIESWGMLDPEDPSYDLPNEDAAYEVIKIEPTEEQLIQQFGGCNFLEKVKKLILAKEEILGK
tara:strand:+ start:554 stop:1045 length:492 start_codon:yes stop_codon:yes gene_type:complete